MARQLSRRDFFKGSIVVAAGAFGSYVLSSCSPAPSGSSSSPDSQAASSGSSDATKSVTLHRGYGSAPGDNTLTQIVVATAEDGTILGASIDDYEFMPAATAGIVPVPNSDAGFGKNYAAGQVMVSKTDSSEAYSAEMKAKGGSTQPWAQSMKAIQEFCAGKKPADLEKASLDSVSGATLVHTPDYLKLVSKLSSDSGITTMGKYTGDGSDLKVGRALAAAHGKDALTSAVALVQGDTMVAASIDDYQFFDATTAGLKPVPSSDKTFGKGYVSGKALGSKSVNDDIYSALMKEKAQATMKWLDSMSAIESFVAGKKIEDVKADAPDAVSGATLVDAPAYVKTAASAAKAM